jgi:hypothetical protein
LSFDVFDQKRRYIKFDRAIREEINEKRNASIRLDLEGQKNTFSLGETIRGMLSLESAKALKIRKIEIILEAIEFAQAKGKKKEVGYLQSIKR